MAILFNSKLIRMLTHSTYPSLPLENEHIRLPRVVSSAQKIKFKLSLTVYISFIYIMNKSGFKIEP